MRAISSIVLVAILITPTLAEANSRDVDDFDFYLITIGKGEAIFMRGGHTMLGVHDRTTRRLVGYNWGIFDFNEPNFALKFFRGVLQYTVMGQRFPNLIQQARANGRAVWQDRLHLTRTQKEIILNRIQWWLRPENKWYGYSIWFKNCSTIVRDILDEALKGKLKGQAHGASSGMTFRDYGLSSTTAWPYIYVALDIVLNRQVDQVMSEWEHMHRPLFLRKYLLGFSAYDDNGHEQEIKLAHSGRRIVTPPPLPQDLMHPYMWAAVLFYLPLAAFFALKSVRPRGGRRILGGLLILWGFLAAFISTVMILTWAFSQHTELHHNANLLLFWPTDLLFLAAGFLILYRPEIRLSPKFATIMNAYCWLKGVVVLAYGIMAWFGDQQVWRVLVFFGPLTICLAILTILALHRRDRQDGPVST